MSIEIESLIALFPKTRITYINNVDDKRWKNWKAWEDCSPEEKEEANLREILPTEIILDIEEYNDIALQILIDNLNFENLNYYIYKTGSRGIHVALYFSDLQTYTIAERNQIRLFYIKKYNADESKSRENTLIAWENKPHFKTMNKKLLLHEKAGENLLNPQTIKDALTPQSKQKNDLTETTDISFADYFEKDPFWLYLNNAPEGIPLGTQRNNIVLPNLAIAAVKSGKTEEETKTIITDFLKRKMPDIPYSVFNGWYKKAVSGEMQTYNILQINSWLKQYRNDKPIYDVTITEESADNIKLKEIEKNKFKFYYDNELKDIANHQTEWLVDNWLAEGDISFTAGKAASFKTTAMLHMAYCIANGLDMFGKYKTKKSKVLYLNEENNNNLFITIVKRVKKGLELQSKDSDNIAFGLLEGIKLDSSEDINHLANFMLKNEIRVLFLDSFRRFVSFDENNATEMNKLFDFMKKLRSLCNITIIGIHHLKKDNNNYKADMRDMLRGSSDIVNSADSIIGIERGHKNNFIMVQHIKNRAGEELAKKKIAIESGLNKDMAKFTEVSDVEVLERATSKIDEAGDAIVHFLEDNNMAIFSRKDLNEKLDFSFDTMTKALRQLVNEGTLQLSGTGKGITYSFKI